MRRRCPQVIARGQRGVAEPADDVWMDLQDSQDGVVSRRQLIDAHPGHDIAAVDAEIERRLRRREWARIHPGVFVDHTGPPTWRQLAWAAVLFYEPAALAAESALNAWGVRGYDPDEGDPIRVCVDRKRSVRRRVGIHVRQISRAETLCVTGAGIPRQRVEHAFLDVASRKARLEGSIAVLADAIQDRRTTVARLLAAINERTRLRQRGIMREVLGDVGSGVRSVLEHRYLVHVERAHGLPRAERQLPATRGAAKTEPDVDYREYGLIVELNGKLGHDRQLDEWADFERDIASAVEGKLTLRAGWRQVLSPCRLAKAVGAVLARRGWTGQIRPCGPDCAAIPAPSAGDVARMG